ncbi:hypothetical protein J0H58_29540 [bacterium]|nr:hypothetical protein [bacterium]
MDLEPLERVGPEGSGRRRVQTARPPGRSGRGSRGGGGRWWCRWSCSRRRGCRRCRRRGGRRRGRGADRRAAIAATAALVELAKAGKDPAYQQESRARELAEVSGAQAAQVAQLDAGRIQRDVESGQNTAGTSGQLTDSIDRFEDSVRPLTDAIDNVSNVVGSKVLDVLSVLAEFVEPLANAVSEIAKNLPGHKEPPKDEAFGEQLARIDQEMQQRAATVRRAADAARDAMRRRG